MKTRTLAAALLLSVASIAAASAQEPSDSSKTCIMSYDVHDTRSPDDNTIIFYMYSGKEYKTTLRQTCPQLSMYGFTYAPTPPDQICGNLQTIRVNGRPQICVMGPIVPYTPPGKS